MAFGVVDDEYPSLELALEEHVFAKLRCYRVWITGEKRSRFMTPMQLRHQVGMLPDESMPDSKVHLTGHAINWERVAGGATLAELVDWNYHGEQL